MSDDQVPLVVFIRMPDIGIAKVAYKWFVLPGRPLRGEDQSDSDPSQVTNVDSLDLELVNAVPVRHFPEPVLLRGWCIKPTGSGDHEVIVKMRGEPVPITVDDRLKDGGFPVEKVRVHASW